MTGLETRSGRTFSPFGLWNPTKGEPIDTSIDLGSLMQAACKLEDERFLANADDAEGMELSSRPPSPLTPLQSDSEYENEDAPPPTLTARRSHTHNAKSTVPGSIEKKRKRQGKCERRRQKRIADVVAGHAPYTYRADPSLVKSLPKVSEPLQLDIDASALPKSSVGAWIGKRTAEKRDTPWTPQELDELGFMEIVWDGSKIREVHDIKKRIITVLVGHPQDPEWNMVHDDATDMMRKVRMLGLESDAFDEKYLNHRRGDFVALPVGVSFGGGGSKPGNLVHTKERQKLIQKLLDSPSIKRVAGFQSSAVTAFAPKLYKYLAEMLGKLFNKQPGLVHNFSNSIFPAASFNCGPNTVSLSHTDSGNLSHNFCPITTLGNYDHTKGGHIILVPLKIYIQCPPGSTVLIPSACVEHANTPIQEGETRYSIVQYAAGGLFRWVAYGFKSAKTLVKTASGKVQKARIDKEEGVRWAEGLAMFSKAGELSADLEEAFGRPPDN